MLDEINQRANSSNDLALASIVGVRKRSNGVTTVRRKTVNGGEEAGWVVVVLYNKKYLTQRSVALCWAGWQVQSEVQDRNWSRVERDYSRGVCGGGEILGAATGDLQPGAHWRSGGVGGIQLAAFSADVPVAGVVISGGDGAASECVLLRGICGGVRDAGIADEFRMEAMAVGLVGVGNVVGVGDGELLDCG